MNRARLATVATGLLAVLAAAAARAQAVEESIPVIALGPAPRLEGAAAVGSLPVPAPMAKAAVPGIDTASRAAVRAAYKAYWAIAMPPIGYTGNVAACNAGSISAAFQDWTLTRINFLRGLAGVGNVVLDSSRNAAQQAAALIGAANDEINHFPPPSSACYTSLGAAAAGASNLARGVDDAVPLYMADPGDASVGHRRWILHSAKGSFGIGQVEDYNAMYVFDESIPRSVPAGIPWPPRGHVPVQVFPSHYVLDGQLWSFGLPGANFSGATVSVALDGAPVPITVVSRTDNGYGDNTIVWQMPAGHQVSPNRVYDITVSGVGGTPSSLYNYQVRPFDADAPVAARLDVNGDGRSDIVYRNESTGQVYRLLMNGNAIAGAGLVYTEPNTAWRIVGDGDVDGDGIGDLVFRNASTGVVYGLRFGPAGTPAVGGTITTEPNAAWKIVATPDIDGDSRADLLWWNASTGQVFVMLLAGTTVRAQGFAYTEPNTAWRIAATGDFSGSGRANQLVWRNETTGQVYLQTVQFVANGNFTASGATIYSEPNTAWRIAGAVDLNGDGRSDLVWRNESTGQVYAMLMSGGTIQGAGLIHTEPNLAWRIAALGDYDGDGRGDLLWRNESTGAVYLMRMDGLAVASGVQVYREQNLAWKVMGPPAYAQ